MKFSEKHTEKKKHKQNMSNLWGNINLSNKCIIGTPETW